MTEPESGHRSLPHTADPRIEAWGPTRQARLGEAVAAVVESFADVSTARPERTATTDLAASDDEDALVSVLDEVDLPSRHRERGRVGRRGRTPPGHAPGA
ncbi:SHS2 domain-containing protein [Saccharopolyspora lacisalsi]|uniref:SHS2 domain-containing protein n=1 Tax=Halosaccharopolyspora lacisalsi TaxID=1000566 RepID=A0A839DYL9_9PSEU|nr:archease [Halosaccharopolyspora lacisalsi]MBA8824465.1 SHS2 domain-containing protein [Halosaccharopolyspora lacisalsi]